MLKAARELCSCCRRESIYPCVAPRGMCPGMPNRLQVDAAEHLEGQMEGCAGVHKRQNCPLGTRPLCLSSSARSRGKRRLSARQSKSHSTCTPLSSPGLIITHISERSWHGHNISPSSSYIWQQPIHLKRTSESLGC